MENPTAKDTKPPTTESHVSMLNLTSDKQAKAMARLWTALSSIYGASRWEREYGAQPSDAWRHTLCACTLDDLARGVEKAQRDDSGRLPSAGQFRGMCQGPKQYPDALPHLSSSSETVKHWHFMWVYSGIRDITILSTTEREEFQHTYGLGPYEKWDQARVKKYCDAATAAIKANRPLPRIA